mmetsp:Transcript_3122/g.4371  ORF Transcript_3122/g.4371 Transcript_3122/m.4371 type:complete len:279 (+) Transcript_3122:143-979(+)
MFLALKLLCFLGVFCKFLSALVANSVFISKSCALPNDLNLPKNPNTANASNLRMLQSENRIRFQRSRPSTELNVVVLPDPYPVADVDLMRRMYGPRRHWWGDYNGQQTRAFYHDLLPIDLMKDMNFLSLEERARRASMARHAARIYARERCSLPSRLLAALYDGVRHLQKYGTWNTEGLTWEELWHKYELQIKNEIPFAGEYEMRQAISQRILEKSCCTNKMFDSASGIKKTQNQISTAKPRNIKYNFGPRIIRKPISKFLRAPMLRPGLFQAIRRCH